MSRRVKDVAYDEEDLDDGYDEYDEDPGTDELSAEDQQKMQHGKASVKQILGSQYSVPDKAIEDALWDSYYDVTATVSFLKNKYKPKSAAPNGTTKQPKPVSRFDQAANAAAVRTGGDKAGSPPFPPSPLAISKPLPFSAADFFRDTPWLNVPEHRRGNITIEPRFPQMGLLGGSSKPSKLAALAAARKKKQEEDEAKAAAPVNAPSDALGGHEGSDRALSLLDRLGGKEKDKTEKKENAPIADSTVKSSVSTQLKSYPLRRKESPSPEPPSPLPQPSEEVPKNPKQVGPDLRGAPSTFAQTVVGHTDPRRPSNAQPRENSSVVFPYLQGLQDAKYHPFTGPSPDDVVLNAQSKAASISKTSQSKSKTDGGVSGITNRVSAVAVEEVPRAKSKNLNVSEEFATTGMKKTANFVVIGHVDHGKSTLMGRLLYDLKVIDQRSVDKLRKEADTIGKSSFALAWIMDSTSEERSRGVTVDIATSTFETDKTKFTILDAPGHQDFITNMIAGTSQADFAVLVIDAGTNAFESGLRGQTKEHAMLARSIGVQRLIVAVNKMDSVSWSRARFEEIKTQMTAFLTKQGFRADSLAFVPCAGLTGGNILSKPTDEGANWSTGHTLVEELDASQPASRSIEKPLRMTINDIFRGGVQNPLSISGRIEQGNLQVGDQVLAMPAGEKAFIKGIDLDDEPADWAVAGQIPTLHLQDIDPIHLRQGDVICSATSPLVTISKMTLKLLTFQHVMPQYVDVLRGRLMVEGKISKLVGILDKATFEVMKKKPRVLQPESVARVIVEMEKAAPLEVGARVILRAEGQTLGAGIVEEVG